MIAKKSDGSQVKEKESTDSSTTIEDDEVKGKSSPSRFSVLVTMIKSAARAKKLWNKTFCLAARANTAESSPFGAGRASSSNPY